MTFIQKAREEFGRLCDLMASGHYSTTYKDLEDFLEQKLTEQYEELVKLIPEKQKEVTIDFSCPECGEGDCSCFLPPSDASPDWNMADEEIPTWNSCVEEITNNFKQWKG